MIDFKDKQIYYNWKIQQKSVIVQENTRIVYDQFLQILRDTTLNQEEQSSQRNNETVSTYRPLDDIQSTYLLTTTQKFENQENYPVLCSNWNQGKFQVVINKCTQCESHQISTRHEEADFCEKFNLLGILLNTVFENIEIIGNYENPQQLEAFEVYIRGVGPEEMRDQQGRIWLFRKNESIASFLAYFDQRMLRVYDGLILLSQGYGDSTQMQKAQELYFQSFNDLYPKKSINAHDFPISVMERQKKQNDDKKKDQEISAGTVMICKNWGCGQTYIYKSDINQANKKCQYHPGVFDLGSSHGLWPQSWVCCRGKWESKGCKIGYHNGQTERKIIRLCINHGDINPETGHPDSACGKNYTEQDSEQCKFHRGYFKIENRNKDSGYWTCCNQCSQTAEGCYTQEHQCAVWPDVKAKIYFVEKPLKNPGIVRNTEIERFDKTALKSSIYRLYEQYTVKNKQINIYKKLHIYLYIYKYNIIQNQKPYVTEKTQLEEERKAHENEIRICMNWGCEEKNMRFKEIDKNTDMKIKQKTCNYHPGYFDFGSVKRLGESLQSIATLIQNQDNKTIHANAIRPRWTCCRREWKAKGCKLTYHNGPIESTISLQKLERWPNVNAMRFFKKNDYLHFKKKIGEQIKTQDQINHFWYSFSVGKETIPEEKLGELCDKFQLTQMALSDDLSYHFKYFDVLRGLAAKILDNGNGYIERQKFSEWWLKPLDKYPINV
ncbi:hypothetical protein IMG5_195060 [Ichthyophthirius multifiliis]|uniref:Uncharacterized protein n=1 Tax=Ichthyophthirius multifiliis TaxID=5932 RepID=G0R4V9_ICHMU|nr:hypothetical protein IMG5_195060 [Ichthyophthirius multifiliis]EGR27502.1 hypothetical protein IMG5_195060 [Ichthyophthirius multifiliis]|eukprot:XP_004024412.1 hypothetical protein IMG5_195060 [Ichthyophthirius multifiliis]